MDTLVSLDIKYGKDYASRATRLCQWFDQLNIYYYFTASKNPNNKISINAIFAGDKTKLGQVIFEDQIFHCIRKEDVEEINYHYKEFIWFVHNIRVPKPFYDLFISHGINSSISGFEDITICLKHIENNFDIVKEKIQKKLSEIVPKQTFVWEGYKHTTTQYIYEKKFKYDVERFNGNYDRLVIDNGKITIPYYDFYTENRMVYSFFVWNE